MRNAANLFFAVLGTLLVIAVGVVVIARANVPPTTSLPPLPTKIIFIMVLTLVWVFWGLAERIGYWIYALLVKQKKVARTEQAEGRVVGFVGLGVIVFLMAAFPGALAVHLGLRAEAGRFILCYEIGMALVALVMLFNSKGKTNRKNGG